jgi:hypothetical protein
MSSEMEDDSSSDDEKDQDKLKKKYSVTTDDLRKRFIELWNSGHCTIK